MRKLKYPEFTALGSLALVIGVSIATLQFIAGDGYHGWIVAGLLIGSGIFMLARSKLATALLAVGIVYVVYWQFSVGGLSDTSFPKISLILLILLGLLGTLFGQIRYFVTQRRSEQINDKQKADDSKFGRLN